MRDWNNMYYSGLRIHMFESKMVTQRPWAVLVCFTIKQEKQSRTAPWHTISTADLPRPDHPAKDWSYGQSPYFTKILDFRGFDSSRILILRGGILMSIGNFPEVFSQRILVGSILLRRLGVSGKDLSVSRLTWLHRKPASALMLALQIMKKKHGMELCIRNSP